MSKTQDELRARKIHNDHAIASMGDGVMVAYAAHDPSRQGIATPHGWMVSNTKKSYPGHWTSRGMMVFHGRMKDATAKAAAFAFAAKETGERTWVRTPFGGWVSTKTAKAVGISGSAVEVPA